MEPALAWSLSVVSRPQYLRPSRRHMRVFEYVPLEKYDYWRLEGEKMVRLSVSVRQSVRICVFVVGLLCCERRGSTLCCVNVGNVLCCLLLCVDCCALYSFL